MRSLKKYHRTELDPKIKNLGISFYSYNIIIVISDITLGKYQKNETDIHFPWARRYREHGIVRERARVWFSALTWCCIRSAVFSRTAYDARHISIVIDRTLKIIKILHFRRVLEIAAGFDPSRRDARTLHGRPADGSRQSSNERRTNKSTAKDELVAKKKSKMKQIK